MNSKYELLEDEELQLEASRLGSASSFTPWNSFAHWRKSKMPPRTARPQRSMSMFWSLLLYSLALWGIVSIIHQLVLASPRHHSSLIAKDSWLKGCDCGESVAEAMTLGCKFDALSMAWLPEHCRDDELTAEFDTTGKGPNGTWIYYADTKHTMELNVSEVAAMGDDSSKRAHMDKDWHQIHCFYYWLKLHRTRANGKIIEPRSDTEAHIRHCGMVFREPGYGTISGVALNTNEVVEE